MPGNKHKISLSLAEKTGIVALGAAGLLFFVYPLPAIIVLVAFLVLCCGAPFFPQSSFFLPVISRGRAGTRAIALTFDDGPSPASTPVLLRLLARHKLQATFFVVGEKAGQYPALIGEILAQGHSIGNHSWSHDTILALRSLKTIEKDIRATQETLQAYGVRPLVFRPPVGISSPRLVRTLAAEDLVTVTFSCRAFDRGNRDIANLADKILARLQPGHIIMLHDLVPQQKDLLSYWQKELDHLFHTLAENYEIAPLEQVIGRPVMTIVS